MGVNEDSEDNADDWWSMTTEQPKTRMAREVELLWGLREPSKRGPKPKLTREAIVDAAVAVADGEGLEAVSMQRVAKELGYTTMSLYRHVDSKEDMLALMSDAVMDGTPPGPRGDGDWRAGVEEWARGVTVLYRRHPWAVHLEMSGPPSGPNGLRWMEAGLREFVRSGLDVGWALQMLTMLSAALRDMFRIEVDMSRAAQATGGTVADTERDYSEGLRKVVTEEELPTISRLLEERVLDGQPPPDEPGGEGGLADELVFSIHRLLDGIEVYVERRRAGANTGAADTGTADGG